MTSKPFTLTQRHTAIRYELESLWSGVAVLVQIVFDYEGNTWWTSYDCHNDEQKRYPDDAVKVRCLDPLRHRLYCRTHHQRPSPDLTITPTLPFDILHDAPVLILNHQCLVDDQRCVDRWHTLGVWCTGCLGEYSRSQYLADRMCRRYCQPTGQLHLLDCYGYGCQRSVLDADGGNRVHCVNRRCGGPLETVSQFILDRGPKFDARQEVPDTVIRCNGYKCRQDGWTYEETGVWCLSCHGLYSHSDYYADVIVHRFRTGQNIYGLVDGLETVLI